MVGPLADQQILILLDSALRMLLNAGVDIERAGASWSVLQSLAQTHAASNRRLSSARQTRMRKKLVGLDAVLTLTDAGICKARSDEWFHRSRDLTIDRMLPELKDRNSKQ